jgi:long-chain acyl-CoA synthetase
VGRPYYGINSQILDPDPKTGFGEIVAKSRNIFMGFHLDEDRTKEAFTSGDIL